jgi:glycosyltransferase involved in cell wall biosynthesis
VARIVTVFRPERAKFVPVDMSLIRWLKISEALARAGHDVDIASNEPGLARWLGARMGPRLRRVPLPRVRWERYDVVKTLFHRGFETLERHGGDCHPFIIAKLGSLVGDRELAGVYFYGEERRQLFDVQRRIALRARYVTLLSEPSRALWRECHGERGNELLVPGAVDAELPPAGVSPYPAAARACVFAGNLYDEWYQAAVHRVLIDKVNALGRDLSKRGIRLHVLGHGDQSRIDKGLVSCHGAVPYDATWDYLRFADAGVVLAFGPEPNHNESTKIYHYLRVGLPTVCEAGFPNERLVEEAGLGVVARNGDMQALADAVERCFDLPWDRDRAVAFVRERHTWDTRARVYDDLIRSARPATLS